MDKVSLDFEKKKALARLGTGEDEYLRICLLKPPCLSTVIGNLLTDAGFSIKVLADHISADKSNLNNAINGKRAFPRDILLRLCICCCASVEQTEFILALANCVRLRDYDKNDMVAKMILESKSCMNGFDRLYYFDILTSKSVIDDTGLNK